MFQNKIVLCNFCLLPNDIFKINYLKLRYLSVIECLSNFELPSKLYLFYVAENICQYFWK